MNEYQQQAPQPGQPIIINNSQSERKRVNHTFHLIVTLLTAGLWLPVWVIVSLAAR